MKFFERLAQKWDELLIEERIQALPVNRRRELLARLVAENKGIIAEWLTG